jgi:hypothetical protein
MKMHTCFRLFSVLALAVAAAAAVSAQDSAPPSQNGQNAAGGRNGGGGYGQRRGGGGFGMMGAGLMGTVTATSADQYTIKTDAGVEYAVHFSGETRIFKMPASARREGGQDNGGAQGAGQGRSMGGNPPQQLKSSDIKVGDVVQVRGQIDEAAKSVPAVAIVQLDPDRVAQIREMNANFGKTWLMGEVTSIDGVKVTLTGSLDNAPHSFVADENTTFRQRRDPITLADIKVGDVVRADGAVKGDAFTATTVTSMGAPQSSMQRVPPPPGPPPPPAQPAPQ